MKFFIKTIYLILAVSLFTLNITNSFSRDVNIKYSKEEVFNYLSGTISLNRNNSKKSLEYFGKIKSLGEIHSNYNIKFIRSLILSGKFKDAFAFAENISRKDEKLFEVNLLLGLQAYIKNDYENAHIYFKRLNNISSSSFLFEDFFGNILNSWIKASENNKIESFKFLNKIPKRYNKLKIIQESFLHCYFDSPKTQVLFEKVIGNENRNFSRYNYFLVNYLLSKNEHIAAKLFIHEYGESHDSPLLIRQTHHFIKKNKIKKITNFFNCKKPKDSMAEIFYVIANMYSTQKNYQMSNFYLNISLYLNDKFKPNIILLAENYYFQNKFELSKKTYNSAKSIGSIYSWFASKSISLIIKETENKKNSISYLKKAFDSLKNLNFNHYYELANYYKDNELFEESIEYYSLALKNINQENELLPKILDRRGISYERTGKWKKAEKDFLESLRLSPEQPYVLNYLAYTWVDKKINIDKALKMLQKAVELKKNDGYIIDSLGWAYYRNENYIEAEKFLQKAVKLLPLDPIINDHYADALWMLNKNIQARYFWKNALGLDSIESKTKEKINQKLIFGINNKS